MQIIRLDKLHPNLHQADSMVLAADRCFSTEFIALWIQTHGQRVQTETRPLNPTESFPGDRAALQYHVREDTPREKGNKGDAGDDGLSSAVGQGTEHEGWALGPFPPSRRWLCNAPQFFCNPNKFKARTQQKAIAPPPSPFPHFLPKPPAFSSCFPPTGSQPSWGQCVPCQGSASLARAGCCMGETARMHRRAVPRASGCTATPGTHARVPAKCRGQPRRHLVLCAPLKTRRGASICDVKERLQLAAVPPARLGQRTANAPSSWQAKTGAAGVIYLIIIFFFFWRESGCCRREKVMI